MVQLQSILDNDFYKFTMQQAVIRLFPRARVKYRFINRGNHSFPKGFAEALRSSVRSMQGLRLGAEEKQWLAINCPYLDPVYLDFLQGYSYDPAEVTISQSGDALEVAIEGFWYRTILWEVPLLCLISENFYVEKKLVRESDELVREKAGKKAEAYGAMDAAIAEFGTRRRHSFAVQSMVVETLKKFGKTFVGTSNVYLAMLHDTKPIGTHAHEWFMFHGAKYGFKMANTLALEHWVDVYRGELGIALADTYTTDEFYEVFDKKFARLFDGVRHDSGDPLVFAEKTIRHYRNLGIDPLSKTIIFSDALHPQKVKQIADYCRGRIRHSFGIGTNFTNDVGLPPMNIVIKMTSAMPAGENWMPVLKLSDEVAKHTGEERSVRLAMEVLRIGQEGSDSC